MRVEASHLLLLALLPPFATAPLALLVARASSRAAGALSTLASALSLASCLAMAAYYPNLGLSVDMGYRVEYVRFPFSTTFLVDKLSWLIMTLASLIGLLCLAYSIEYMAGDPWPGRYYFWMLVFIGSMIGLASADNLLLLVAFWELTTISSFSLIGHWVDREEALWGSYKALMFTGLGGLCLIAGVALSYYALGASTLSELIERASSADPATLNLVLALMTVAIASKSAQFPFHTWLPDAMVAPTPVSALLHAAAMVKAGVYLAARLVPVYACSQPMACLLMTLASVTMVVSSLCASYEEDLKRILAFSTVGHLALMISAFSLSALLLSAGLGELAGFALLAGMFHLLNHSLTKSSLFLVAGAIEHEAGTRLISELGGVFKRMPRVALAFIVSGLALVGLPPLNGFYSKWMMLQAYVSSVALAGGRVALLSLTGLLGLVAIAVFGFLYIVRPALTALLGEPSRKAREAHEPPAAMWLPPLALASAAVAVGLIPGLVASTLTPLPGGLRQPSGLSLLELPGALSPVAPLHTASVLAIGLLIGLAVTLIGGEARVTPPYLAGERYEDVYGSEGPRMSGPGFIEELLAPLRRLRLEVDVDRGLLRLGEAFDEVSRALRRLHTGSLTLYLAVTAVTLILITLALVVAP